MITTEVRNKIIEKLYSHLQIPVIPSDEDADIPERPYTVYSITSDYVKNGQDSITYKDENDQLIQRYENLVEATFSFSVHSDSRDEAMNTCYSLIEYFDRIGHFDLSDTGITVIDISNVQNRSVLLVDHFERRFGADVRFRYLSKSEQVVDKIEHITFENTGGE